MELRVMKYFLAVAEEGNYKGRRPAASDPAHPFPAAAGAGGGTGGTPFCTGEEKDCTDRGGRSF